MLHPISWSLALPYYSAAFVFGYLLGSIPFGLILTRLAGTADLRTIGSGNIGATNVLRTGRKGLAALTLLCDALKGTLAAAIAYRYGGQDLAVLAALGAFLGHLFPVWLKFSGGKGVATYLGLLVFFSWPVGARLRRHLARDRRGDALLLGRRARGERRDADHPVASGLSAGGAALRSVHRPALAQARRKCAAARRRPGRQDRARPTGRRYARMIVAANSARPKRAAK